LVKGDFVKFYAQAHKDLGIGMFCFCDFAEGNYPKGNTYKWTTAPWRGYTLKFLPRFVGIMMSIDRPTLEKVGYFDAAFGQFGEEHSDFTIRVRLAGGIQVEGQDMNQLDVEHSFLSHQDVPTSVQGFPRKKADEYATKIMSRASAAYKHRHFHRPFRLALPEMSQGYRGGGIPTERLLECGYSLVSDLV